VSTDAVTPAAPPTPTTPVSRGSVLNQGVVGMSIFIGSEVMLFASFFTAYFLIRFSVFSNNWPPIASNGEPFELPKVITGVNTFILVSSSFVVWWAEKCMLKGDRKGLVRGLTLTIMMGATFITIQFNEYIHLGFTPDSQAFGSVFYSLTGLHGAHVLVGLTILTFCLVRALKGDFSKEGGYAPLAAGSIYWHFVDVVWVILYLLVYIAT
jgi:cytochrome c oxidase subunit III